MFRFTGKRKDATALATRTRNFFSKYSLIVVGEIKFYRDDEHIKDNEASCCRSKEASMTTSEGIEKYEKGK